MGSSRAVGGIIRGHAQGNHPSFADMTDQEMTASNVVTCYVHLYQFKGVKPALIQPGENVNYTEAEVSVTANLGDLLKWVVDVEPDIQRKILIIY